MNSLIRAAFVALSLASITTAASAATTNNALVPAQQDNQIGMPGPGWG
jgi:hypothetical protein